MDKRYQVFVSSTYTDLKEERRSVVQALMEMDCIPAGMELFPALDEEQWQFIRRVIDDCDYYLLIIGGRYGSVTPEGISYTEKEYDYAVERGLKVVALIHDKPDEIPAGKTELDQASREKLEAFREKVKTGRLVRTWNQGDQLPGLVALSLSKTIKTYPAVGWVRGDAVSNQDLLSELNSLRKENTELTKTIQELTEHIPPAIEGLAGLDETFQIDMESWHNNSKSPWKVELPWREIFGEISPHLLAHPSEAVVKKTFEQIFAERLRRPGGNHNMSSRDFKTISVQLHALGLTQLRLASTVSGRTALFWSLTPHGDAMMLQTRAVRASTEKCND